MTDDPWRRGRAEPDDDFGPPLFGDDPQDGSGGLSFGEDTGPLPHWTEPPTGEIPRVHTPDGGTDPTDDLDVWSSFSGQQPVWRDGADDSGGLDDITGLSPVFEEPEFDEFDEPAPTIRDESAPVRREPGRITIGTDPTDGAAARPAPSGRRGRADASKARGGRQAPPPRVNPGAKPAGGTKGRDMPTAIAVGAAIAAAFVGIVKLAPPWAVLVVVLLVLGMAAVEYFDRVREKGYQPAFIPGIFTCVMAPAVAYFYGVEHLPLVAFLSFTAVAVSFIGATSLDSNPMPNMAITSLGVMWIGILGSFGAAIVGWSNLSVLTLDGPTANLGTDTLTLLAIAVVANDVGALFVGSAIGRTPLRAWISPNKSVEGFVGGALFTVVAMFVVGMLDKSTTWNTTGDLLLLGLVVAIMAPIGDLTESMFKRNLDVKDFGSLIKGHGGVLDRFDGFLFTMPAVYYLAEYLQPWAS